MAVAHNLAKDFPEYKDSLAQRVKDDSAFCRLVDDYLQLDQRICELEELDQAANDGELGSLRKQRVLLKDGIELALKTGTA